MLEAPAGFHYTIIDNKVCEIEQEGPTNSLNKCLTDICDYYNQNIEGFDALHHLLLEKIT